MSSTSPLSWTAASLCKPSAISRRRSTRLYGKPWNGTKRDDRHMNTKERIIEMAIRLFNEQGTGAVSTNHIAEALAMSPGNLYYHFRNKEEIIRAILERMIARWEALYAFPEERTPQMSDVRPLVTENFWLVWEYRFFYRELSTLVQRDPVLKGRYQQIRRERLAKLEALFQRFLSVPSPRSSQTPTSVTNLAR